MKLFDLQALGFIFLTLCIVKTYEIKDPFEDRPRIIVQDGNLILKGAVHKNITIASAGEGTVHVNSADFGKIASSAQTVGSQLPRVDILVRELAVNRRIVGELLVQVNKMEENITILYNRVNRFLGSGPERISNRALRRAISKVNGLTDKVNTLTQLLTQNECSSNPCRNGGTCIDAYNGFICNCPSNWEGVTCEADVNECAVYAGTSFGCQNGATCINTHGGYSCTCPPNWYGIDCSEKHDDCGSASHYELCGHGTCVNEKRRQPGQPNYRCICDSGWKVPNGGLACTEDIDECSGQDRKCSQSPLVTCINTAGSFHCGPCPSGFTGNGYYCSDINECNMNNGGCSMNPHVPCVNTYGSSQCGACPRGFAGNGRVCTFTGICSINRGGCHPNATCIENSAITNSYRECRCPPGYGGDGVGLHGCYPMSGMSCANNPCQHGTCQVAGQTFHCICNAGYYGTLCDRQEDPCFSQPCQNGGTCLRERSSLTCVCQQGYKGPTCAEFEERCGGNLSGSNGTLTYPENGVYYKHKQDCAWVISVAPNKVVQVKVNHFSLESAEDCQHDFLQLHDGPTPGARIINRYCDDHIDGQSLVSTHNRLYMWFHSDSSLASTGFSMEWLEVDPVCGGELNISDYGSINSPGYPGPYPLNRTCLWLVKVPIGKRIQFHFATLKLESHENCSYDYLKVFDGATERDPLLGTYCTTVTPPPMTTSGHTATLLFHSDASVQDTGFHIVYSSQPNVQGCGGVLTSPIGTVNSPNFPDVYENNLVCEWLIRVHPENRLLLTFQEFHVESHTDCSFDAVEVYAGANDAAPLLGRFCGTTVPSDLFSQSNQLFVRFKSDSSLRYKGFKAEYRTICGGVYTEPSGILSSPYYPDNYPSRAQCIYEIRLEPGNLVNVTFHNMEIEEHPDCRFDYLQVRDGDKEDSPLIALLCGTTVPESILSTYNFLWMKFETDGSVQNRGFYAIYDTIDMGCGGVITEPSGQISSPRHPDAYPHSITCTWLLKATPGHVVRLTFSTFNTEQDSTCRFDYVLVEDTNSVVIGKYCGNRKPPILTSMDETMLVKFVADASVAREGFIANYEFLDVKEACGGDFYQEAGVIRSPGFPNRYPHNSNCIWILHAPNMRQLSLNITSFTLEQHTGCRYDYLEIRNGGTNTSPLFGKFCGSEIMRNIRSQSNVLRLEFKTDSSMSAPGFELYFDSTATGCGGKLTSPRGSIVSPNYPQAYPLNANCEWLIQISEGSVLSIHIVDIDIEEHRECKFDYVQVFDGSTVNSKSLLRVCNNQQNTGAVISTGNSVLILFRSDASQEAGGFQLAYEILCNTVLTKRTGVIESPNFPNTYPHNHNCSWTIEALPGNNISMVFSHFVLEGGESCDADYVEIIEVHMTGEQKQLGKFCGNLTSLPGAFETSSNKAIVRLVTDRSISREGFRLEWMMKGCGGDITNKENGIITSPNYPNGYPFSTMCLWHIYYPPGARVELTILDLELEFATECRYDYIEAFGGEDELSPRLLKSCNHMSEPQIVISHGNKMTVRFASDYSIGRRGFKASFKKIESGCGGIFTADESTIVSPNFPDPYTANDECEWLIKVGATYSVIIEFYDFDIPASINCTMGYVAIYEGNTSSSPLRMKLCGPKPVQAIDVPGNQMLVRLVADGNNVGKGFRAHYKRSCGTRLLADNGGEITTPDYPGYPISLPNCSWIIYASDPGEKVILTITHYQAPRNTDCAQSSVMITDGETPDAPVLKELCEIRSHLPIISHGNSMHILLLYSVVFRATYGLASMHCGGEFKSPEGTFGSPGFPNNYDLEMECIWTIEASASNKVHLSFQMFNLEASEYCNNDYVEIHEKDASGPIIGKYCGNQVPNNVTAARKLWIKFRSDDIATDTGFLANYELMHGSVLQGSEGIIESPGYPKNFHADGDFDWTIFVESGQFISIRFLEINIIRYSARLCSTMVAIYDGLDDAAPVLGEYCGYQIPEAIVTTGNVALIRLKESHHSSGYFRLQWTAVSETGIVIDVPPGRPEDICWEEIQFNSSDQVVINSVNYPYNYPSDMNCTYIIRALHHQHVELFISELELEGGERCEYDSLEVYYLTNPSVNEWTHNTSLCGRRNNLTFSSPTNIMKLVMTTDKFMTHKGFTSTVKPKCGTLFTESAGVIKSDYILSEIRQGQHFQELQCEYIIKVKPRRTIQLVFENFNVPSDSVCSSNYIVFRNGGSSTSPFLGNGKYCGSSAPRILETSSNLVYLQIVVNSLTSTSPSFEIRYFEVSISCGGRLYLTNDIRVVDVMSPNYPHPPIHDIECEWVIVSPSGTRMRMDFENEFHLSPNCNEGSDVEYLQINDGGTELAPPLHRFCGHDQPSSVFSTGNALFARYVTAVDAPQAGFKATVQVANCGGTISAFHHVITSPHYPGAYGNSEECEWFIKMKMGYHINLELTDVDTPRLFDENCTNTDYLEIRNHDSEGELLGLYCGTSNTSFVIQVPGPQAYIKFKSNSANTGRGFSLSMVANYEDGCGGRFDNPSGIITSPHFPSPLTATRECYWRIVAPEGRKVKIDFMMFDLPRDEATGICSSYLMIFNATQWRTRTTWEKLCGNTIPDTIVSPSSDLDIHFFTHGLREGQGFSLSYSTEEESYCGGALYPPNGILATPNFTIQEHTYADCRWRIYNENPENKTVVIRFDVLDVPGKMADYCRDSVVYILGDKSYFMGRFCGNYSSPVIVSSSFSSTMVRLIANLSTSFRGIHATYNISNCGGSIARNANITSPGYPNNYPFNSDCYWIITSPDDGEIQLTFTDLRMEDNCNKDYVLVRNGHHYSSPIIGKFCGTHLPAPITSSSRSLTVIFHSDEYGSAPGFKLVTTELQRGCGGLIHLKHGNITSPGYPSRYENNIECIWIMEYVPGYIVRLQFIGRFELEMDSSCEKDFLLIEEYRKDNSWSIIDRKCGSSTPDAMIINSRKVRLTFQSNNRITGDGFRINYLAACGGNFTQDQGEIFSPNYPDLYENDLQCQYTIGKVGQYVSLVFDENFSLETVDSCGYDKLLIQHRDQDNTTQGPYCGSTVPAPRSLEGPVVIKFITDDSFVAYGFKIKYRIFDCNSVLSEPSGSIQTPAYSAEYLKTIDCTWQIVSLSNRVIALRFKHMDIKVSYQCYNNYLEIRDGNITDPLIGKICGNSSLSVKSLGNMLTLKLHMRADSGGFSAQYYNTFGPEQGCGGTINAASGIIQSLDANNNGLYEPNLDCYWEVTGTADKVLRITFQKFELDDTINGSCEFDYLELREDGTFGNLMGRFCSSTMPSDIISASNKISILFHTDNDINKSGFKLSFSSIDSPCGPSILKSHTEPQSLTSPSYPNPYPVSLHCKWIIIKNDTSDTVVNHSPRLSRSKIQLHLTDFNVPCTGDYVNVQRVPKDVFRRPRVNQVFLREIHMCGSNFQDVVGNSGMEILFHSDSNLDQVGGFSISYKNADCSKNYTSDGGIITSPGYPNFYNSDKRCNATIYASEGKTISLYFLRAEILQCGSSYLSIFDGRNSTAPVLASICDYHSVPNPVFSSKNILYIESYMDSNVGSYHITFMTTDGFQGCGGSVTAEQGALSSPLYPNAFNKTMECIWYISVPGYHTVKLTFNSFELTSTSGCTSNYLEIYDGQTGDVSERIVRYCGSDLTADHNSKSNGIMIKLVTDTSNVGRGFLVNFRSNAYFPSTFTPLIQRQEGVSSEDSFYTV